MARDRSAFETVRRDAFPADVTAESPRWVRAPGALWPVALSDVPARFLVHQARFHVGDTLWLTPLLRAVRRRFPHAEVTVVGPPVARTVLDGNPHVTRIVPYPEGGGPEERGRVLEVLSGPRFDAALLAFARRPESTWLAEALAERGAGVRVNLEYFDTGYDYTTIAPWATHEMWCVWSSLASPEMLLHALDPFFDPDPTDHGDDRRVEYHVSAAARERARRQLAERGLDGEPFVVLTPGGRSSERWPPESFAALAAWLVSELDVGVLIEGSPEEAGLLQDIRRRAPASVARRIHAAADPLDVFAAVLGEARLLVSNDSAPIHFAEAVGTPALYFAQREKLVHSRPAGVARALVDDALPRMTVERTAGAIREMVSAGIVTLRSVK